MHRKSRIGAKETPRATNSTRKTSKFTVIDRAMIDPGEVLAQQPRKIIVSELCSALVLGATFTTRLPKGHPDSVAQVGFKKSDRSE